MKLASFDIFDTTLIRRCGHPENIFWQVAMALFPNDRAQQEAFVLERRRAAQRIALPTGAVEHTLTAIYEHIAACGFAPYTAAEMQATELRIERQNLMANPEVKATIAQLRTSGHTICFISDMYIEAEVLEEVLRREGCLQGEERVWVSVEHQARKDSGRLYDLVRQHYQPTTWHHYGDHKHSDVRMAKRKGITAHHVLTPYTPLEQGLMQLPTTSLWEHQALRHLAGWQRAYRLSQGEDAMATLGANVVAATYVPYVMALLKDAEQRGIKRLYFLSRDGYVLMHIAECIVAHTKQEIELRYLFVSRQALFLPYLYMHETQSHYMAVREKTLRNEPIAKLLKQLGLSREDLATVGIELDYAVIRSAEQQTAFLQAVFGEALAPTLRVKTTQAATYLHRYFTQEGLTDGTPAALVDVGWLGTSRKMINHILTMLGAPQVFSYYLGVRGDALPPRDGAYYSYLPTGRSELMGVSTLVEHYCSASPYTSTKAYREDAGRIVPRFDTQGGSSPAAIVTHNLAATKALAEAICAYGLYDEKVLRCWAIYSLESANTLSVEIDVSPLAMMSKFDTQRFVSKLSFVEVLRLLLLDQSSVALKKASLQYTVGYTCTQCLWPIYTRLARIKKVCYRIKQKYLA